MSCIRSIGTAMSIVFWLASVCFAQGTGTVRGRVVHADSNTGLAGASVILRQTAFGISARTDGAFSIPDVPPGRYTVYVAYIGFASFEQEITVTAGETVDLNISLRPSPVGLSGMLMQSERSYSTASSRAVRQLDLRIRPNRSAQDMLQLAPGLVIAQHAGGGKAEQIFLRGFDADHGTDVAVFTDGIPVNMVSHGHGQGYADLHFLIPEIVESIDVFKGPYFARFGNLATAGSVTIQTKDHVDRNLVQIEGGEFNTAKITTVLQIPTSNAHQGAYFAGQFYNTDGPVDSPQNFQRSNFLGKFHTHVNEQSKISFSLDAFSSSWDASGQIPVRAVAGGQIGRFGSIDDLEGGTTSRQNLNLSYETETDSGREFLVQSFVSRYTFKLFSNFTFFLNDPVNGDMIEQTDERTLFGLNTRYRFRHALGPVFMNTDVGGGLRADDIAVTLWKSPDRSRETLNMDADINERNLFLWAQHEFIFGPQWRLQVGLRGDYFTFNVADHLDTRPAGTTHLPHASGYRQQSIVSPKFNLVYSPVETTELYLNVGSGFHSNDARDVVIAQRIREIEKSLRRQGRTDQEIEQELLARNFDPAQRNVETLPRAVGGEIGVRSSLSGRFTVGLSAWGLHLEEELVFVGDEGSTEISGETGRLGLDIEGRIQVASWLFADADLSISRGRFLNEPGGADHIPLAPRVTSTGGLTVVRSSGFEGNLRYRHIGDRPANETGSVTAEGYSLLNVTLGYRFRGGVRLFADIENLLDTGWNEAQFDTESRLRNEAQSVSEIHFTPGNPRNIRLGIGYAF